MHAPSRHSQVPGSRAAYAGHLSIYHANTYSHAHTVLHTQLVAVAGHRLMSKVCVSRQLPLRQACCNDDV